MTESILYALIAAGSTLAGAGIGAGVTYWISIKLEKRKERKIKEGFLRLLLCDIDSLWTRHNELIGERIKKHNEANIFEDSLNIKQNYFSVFDNNADKILYLDAETSKLVVQLYTRAKVHVDTLDSYGENLTHYYTIQSYLRRDPREPFFLSQNVERETGLRELFKFLKNDYTELDKIVSETKSILEVQLRKYK